MFWICLSLLLSLKNLYQLDNVYNLQNFSGKDERPIHTNNSYVDIYNFKINREKWKLLQQLKSPDISDIQKVKIIQLNHMLEELKPNIVTATNLFKGLDWEN
jgi:hypothetical protein